MDLSTGYPLWLIKNGLLYNYPRLEKSLDAEVVILGGGISGALTAYYLINAGVDCILADARSIGLGSTCSSTSLLQYEIDTPLSELKNKIGLPNAVRSYKLCAEAIYKLGSIAREIKFTDFEFKTACTMPLLKRIPVF